MSLSRPPRAKNAARASRYPLTTHCTPDELRLSSVWMFGTAIDTMVWSMNVIATANTIAVSARYFEPVVCSAGVPGAPADRACDMASPFCHDVSTGTPIKVDVTVTHRCGELSLKPGERG